ncbi:unnamed protein product [Cylicocyclus nassatus]|uniref:Uncharacterized protein n=1 Tax=Cylicocyclus nassatus TaxID=53992 RepID=A0AA36DMZ7_CYLNA|nr:unnamed protein product [Cylicocyclus nassatus]
MLTALIILAFFLPALSSSNVEDSSPFLKVEDCPGDNDYLRELAGYMKLFLDDYSDKKMPKRDCNFNISSADVTVKHPARFAPSDAQDILLDYGDQLPDGDMHLPETWNCLLFGQIVQCYFKGNLPRVERVESDDYTLPLVGLEDSDLDSRDEGEDEDENYRTNADTNVGGAQVAGGDSMGGTRDVGDGSRVDEAIIHKEEIASVREIV